MGSDEYVMVPREPTEEMLRAGLVGVEEPAAPLVGMRRLSNAYRAMLSAAPPSPRSEMREALEAARQFIVNGVELGYIHIPKNDPAEHTLGKINAALKES